jgi:hypothetical protein
LSAWISAIESGVAASSRRRVSRTARPCTKGMVTSATRLAKRNPSPKYMIGSIMKRASGCKRQVGVAPWHAGHATSSLHPG